MLSTTAKRLRAAGLPLAVPVLIAVAFAVAAVASPSHPSITFDPATSWLVSADGVVVRANGLIDAGPAQIVDTVPAPAASTATGLLSLPGHVVVVGTGGTGATIVSTSGDQSRTTLTLGADQLASDGARLYRISGDTVTVVDPSAQTVTASYDTGPLTAWTEADGALYVTGADRGLRRIDAGGLSAINGGDTRTATRLVAVDGGVAAWDPAGGRVVVVRKAQVRRTVRNRALRTTDPAATFGATPDGTGFAVRTTGVVTFLRGDTATQLDVGGAPADETAPELTADRLYLGQPQTGVLRVFASVPRLSEVDTRSFGSPRTGALDVHRTGRFLWYDDVRGPIAYAVHDGHITKVIKYASRPRAPTARPKPSVTTPPTTTPPPPTTHRSTPAHHPTSQRPTHTVKPPQTPRPKPTHTRSPTPKPKPKPDCHGDKTLLSVNHAGHTGDHPTGTVKICDRASPGTEYWIISRVVSDGDVLWFAKTHVNGRNSGPFGFQLYNDAASGGDRDYVVVAARTDAAQQWLRDNLDADRGQGDFDFGDLHGGITEISARVHSAT